MIAFKRFPCSWWDMTLPGVGTNRYAYADNDPINKADAIGHMEGSEAGEVSETTISDPPADPSAAEALNAIAKSFAS